MQNSVTLALAILIIGLAGLFALWTLNSAEQPRENEEPISQSAPNAAEDSALSDASLSQDAERHTEPLSQAEQVASGLILLEDNCSPCHATGPRGDSPRIGAPAFRTLGARYDVALLAEALVEGLVAHPDMPEFQFSPSDADHIISYLQWVQDE